MDGTKIIKNPGYILSLGDLCSLISTPVVSMFQDINHRFQAKIHFRSNFIPPGFFRNAVFFPFRTNSLLAWHQIANGTTNQEAQHEGSPPPVGTEWNFPSQHGFFWDFFVYKNGTLVRKNLWFSEDISIDFFGWYFFGGNPQKGEKK